MSNLFSAGSSKARRLGALSTLAVSALLFSACASENSTAQSSSSATPLGERFHQRLRSSVFLGYRRAGFGLVQPHPRSGFLGG